MMNAEQARARDEMGESENLTSIASDPASGLVMLWIEGVTVCRVGLTLGGARFLARHLAAAADDLDGATRMLGRN